MSIFDSIKQAIFGHDAQAAANHNLPPMPPTADTTEYGANDAQPKTVSASAPRAVDIAITLDALTATNPMKLNWRTSIVDLMELLGLDPSLSNRQALARELGFTGDSANSSVMNTWLHRQVMKKLAESGCKVPQDLEYVPDGAAGLG